MLPAPGVGNPAARPLPSPPLLPRLLCQRGGLCLGTGTVYTSAECRGGSTRKALDGGSDAFSQEESG